MLQAHLASKQKKCSLLDQRIHDELRHPGSNDLEVQHLRKQRLHLEDEIESLRRHETD